MSKHLGDLQLVLSEGQGNENSVHCPTHREGHVLQMAHQVNGHLDSWTLQLNSTFRKLVLGKQTKYPNNIIIKHKYSSDFMTKLA